MDFLTDYLSAIADQLSRDSVTFDRALLESDPVAFLARYLEFRRRRIPPEPRRARIPRELKSSPEFAANRASVTALCSRSESGGDLAPYQSKAIRRFDRRDLLLSDWDIHHFHLGGTRPGSAFSERSDQLIYITVLPSEIRLIAIMDHTSFSEIRLLEIIDSNWPEYLDAFTLRGVAGLTQQVRSTDVEMLRKVHVQTMVQLSSGRVLFPPGGGYATSGTRFRCMIEAQETVDLLRRAEEFVAVWESRIRTSLGIDSSVRIRLADLTESYATIVGDGHSRFLRIAIGSREDGYSAQR